MPLSSRHFGPPISAGLNASCYGKRRGTNEGLRANDEKVIRRSMRVPLGAHGGPWRRGSLAVWPMLLAGAWLGHAEACPTPLRLRRNAAPGPAAMAENESRETRDPNNHGRRFTVASEGWEGGRAQATEHSPPKPRTKYRHEKKALR